MCATARKPRTYAIRRLTVGVTLALVTATGGLSQKSGPANLGDASLEDLLGLQVTSASRKAQPLAKAGSAIFVISQDDILSSGAANIPDLLRMVPGVHVAQLDANVWAISIRGMNDRYADNVLVLIDGRSVYSPTTSGVNWDQQDVPLEDIDRIEVIRGPGGTVWGANAVNGVINIITKSAKLTKGGLVTASADSGKSVDTLAQYGGDIGRNGAIRAFGSFASIAAFPSPPGETIRDGWNKAHGGFRSDWDFSSRDSITVQGDFFRDRGGQTVTTLVSNSLPNARVLQDDFGTTAVDVLGRWSHKLAGGSGVTLQSYYDQYNFRSLGVQESRKTADLDLDYHLTAGSRHDIVFGLGYRASKDSTAPGFAARFNPSQRTDQLFSAFLQDEFKLSSSLWLTLGSKLEHNSYTGYEYEPSARLVWEASDRQSVWLAASRAIRQPATFDTGIIYDAASVPLPNGGVGVVRVMGSSNRKTERLRSFESGYRAQWARQISMEVSTFASFYTGMETTTSGVPFLVTSPVPYLVIPSTLSSEAQGFSYGGEVTTNWSVNHRWRLNAGYSFVHMNMDPNPGAGPEVIVLYGPERNSPRSQFQARSQVSLTKRLSWDATFSRVGKLSDNGIASVPGYNRLDTQLGLRVTGTLEFHVGVRNLTQRRHAEFCDEDSIMHSLVARSVFGKLTWRF